MPFLIPLGLSIGGGLLGSKLSKKNSTPATTPQSTLQTQLQPLIDLQTGIAKNTSTAGMGDLTKARGDLGFVSDWFKKILEGSDDDLLKMVDSSGITHNMDENEQQLSQFGVRGGARAAQLGQSNFDRDAAIQKVLQNLRFAAPGQIANIAQVLGNFGVGELNAATGAAGQASNVLFGQENINQQGADRKSALIGNILGAAGTALGAWLGNR